MLEDLLVSCPYCGELFETSIDCSIEQQSYFEDCQVCCAPILFEVCCDYQGTLLSVVLKTDNE